MMQLPPLRFSALSRRLTCLLGGSLFMLALPATFAANGTWDGDGADANWTTLANWSGDAAFPGDISGTTNGDTATFNSAIANTWGESGTPILIDSASFNIKNITFDTSSVGNYTIGTTTGNALYLTSGGTIQISNTTPDDTTQTISAPLVIMGENATYTFNNARDKITTKLILNGDISAGSAGAAVFNFYGRQGAAPNEANGAISDGAADHVSLIHQTGTWSYTGDNTYTGDTTINAGSARFTGDNSGGGNFTIHSGGAAYFTGTNSYTGSFSLIGGPSTVNVYLGADDSATGSILGVTDISINSSRLYLINKSGNANRLNDSVAISLSGANSIFELQGNAATDTTETIGVLTLGPGYSNISLTNNNGRITTLNAASLTRAAGFGTAVINTRTLGTGTGNAGRIFLGAAPSGVDLVGSGGSTSAPSSVKNLAIVPWLYGTDGGAGRFLTYDAATGLRYLSANETQSSIAAAVAPAPGETGDNVLLTASETGITTKTINSLMLTPGDAQAVTGAGAGNSLVISSGALALTAARTTTVSGFDSVTFGNDEAVITPNHSSGVIQIDSAIDVTGGGGITKTGGGKLILTADNLYSGATTINQGTLQVGNGGATGDLGTSSHINLRTGSTLRVNRTGDLAIGSVDGGGAIIMDQASTLTLNQTGTGNMIDSIGGVSGSQIVFSGDDTAQTTINSALATTGQLVKFTGGTVNLGATRPIASDIEIDGGIVNPLDGQTSFMSATGPQFFTLKSGEFKLTGTYGLSGFNTNGNANSAGGSYTFTGLQTGGSLSILGDGSNQGRFALGSTTAGAVTTYTLSGGTFSALGGGSFLIGASTTGSGSASFNLTGGKLLVAGNQSKDYIAGAQGTGAKQAFVWTGGVLATSGYDATNLTSTADTAVSASTNTLTNGGGILAPGDIGVTGRTTIIGNYAVTSPDAILDIDIAGTSGSGSFQDAPGSGKYDKVTFSGDGRTVTLDGGLHVRLLDGFDGNGSFDIISNTGSGGLITGVFNNTVEDSSGAGQRVVLDNGVSSYLVTYGDTAVTLDSFADNVWAASDGDNWSEAIWWSAFSPQAAGQIAQFTTEASGGSVNLDANRTIGGITFDNASDRYTISSNNGSSLTLDNTRLAGPADSAITVAAGTHTIAVPMSLTNDLNVETTGATSALTVNGAISGIGQALTKTGTGSLTLAAANDYTGNTSVAGGTLFANNTTGSATGTGLLSVSSGATLAGSGAVGSIADISGHLAPGATANSVAVLTFNQAVTLRAGSSIGIDIHGATTRGLDYDGLDFNGALTLEGTALSFNFGSAIADGAVLNIFDGDTALSAGFTSVSASGFGDYNGSFGLSGDNAFYSAVFGNQTLIFDLGSGNLSFAAVPEPATTTLLLGIGALSLVCCGRRKR